ncbi:MAG: hypothetical protein F6K00_29385 [Leptolyngbya sp. SIOISBB]|nr:hypothetical protein [Leptolyngbya sp. SIOISBB]
MWHDLSLGVVIDPNRDCGRLSQVLADLYLGNFKTVEAAAAYVQEPP